jgi:hypothetical protein
MLYQGMYDGLADDGELALTWFSAEAASCAGGSYYAPYSFSCAYG